MWPKHEIDYPADDRLRAHLAGAGVRCARLAVGTHRELEGVWRKNYQRAFLPSGRFRHGLRAVHEFMKECETRWLLVPFLSKVPGTSVQVHSLQMNAFECDGPLQELGEFKNVEFFVSPGDFRWTFVRTHEDFALGGPYFARVESIDTQ
jgi:hypothetical protein